MKCVKNFKCFQSFFTALTNQYEEITAIKQNAKSIVVLG